MHMPGMPKGTSKVKREVSIHEATAISPVLLYVNYDVRVMAEDYWRFLQSELYRRGATAPCYSFFAGFFDTIEQAEKFAETEFPAEIEVVVICLAFECDLGGWRVPKIHTQDKGINMLKEKPKDVE